MWGFSVRPKLTSLPTSIRLSLDLTIGRRFVCLAREAPRKLPPRRREVLIVLRQSRRAFVEKVEFITSAGFLDGGDERSRLGIPGAGPKAVITDLGVLTPDPETKELVLSQIHPGVTLEQAKAATGWNLQAATDLVTTEEPAAEDLRVLRELRRRTEIAHAGQGEH